MEVTRGPIPRELPVLDAVTARLERVLPTLKTTKYCLVRGAFRFGNVIVSVGSSPTTAALLGLGTHDDRASIG